MNRQTHAQRAPDVQRANGPCLAPKRIALVARDFKQKTTGKLARFLDANMGFAPHFAGSVRLASEHRADVVVFSLWSHDARKLGQLTRSMLFPGRDAAPGRNTRSHEV